MPWAGGADPWGHHRTYIHICTYIYICIDISICSFIYLSWLCPREMAPDRCSGCPLHWLAYSDGPSTQYLRLLLPRIMYWIRNLKYWLLGLCDSWLICLSLSRRVCQGVLGIHRPGISGLWVLLHPTGYEGLGSKLQRGVDVTRPQSSPEDGPYWEAYPTMLRLLWGMGGMI